MNAPSVENARVLINQSILTQEGVVDITNLRILPNDYLSQVEWFLKNGGKNIDIFFPKEGDENAVISLMEWRFFAILGEELTEIHRQTNDLFELTKKPSPDLAKIEKVTKEWWEFFSKFESHLKDTDIDIAQDTFEKLITDQEKKGFLPQAFIISDTDNVAEYLAFLMIWPTHFFKDVINNLRIFFHDMRNPIAAVYGYAYLCTVSPDKYLPKTQSILKNILERLATFIHIFNGLSGNERTLRETSLKETINSLIKPLILKRSEDKIFIQYKETEADILTLSEPGTYHLLLDIFFSDFLHVSDTVKVQPLFNHEVTLSLETDEGDLIPGSATLCAEFVVQPYKNTDIKNIQDLNQYIRSYFSTPFKKLLLSKAGCSVLGDAEVLSVNGADGSSQAYKVRIKFFFEQVKVVHPKPEA